MVLISFWCIGYAAGEVLTCDKTFGGSQNDEVFSGIKTVDGGYAVCGYTESKGAGRYDVWVMKLDEKGNLE